MMLIALGFAAFVPMRAHNLAEIESIVGPQETIRPPVIMLAILVLIGFAAIARFGAADTLTKQATESILGAGASLVVAAFALAPAQVGAFMHGLNVQTVACLLFGFGMLFWLVYSFVKAPAE